MTLTDALLGAAALWLLIVICGIPGQRTRGPVTAWDDAALAWGATTPPIEAAPYAVWFQDVPEPRHVTPPIPDPVGLPEAGSVCDRGVSGPEILVDSLGWTPVDAAESPHGLNVTEVTIVPAGMLSLDTLDGSGLLMLAVGRLEMTELRGDVMLIRTPLAGSAASLSRDAEEFPTIVAGDRIVYGAGASIVLHNRSEHPARILAGSIVERPLLNA